MLKLNDYIADWPDIDYPNFRFWFDDVTARWPERTALRFRAGRREEFEEWTYARFREESLAVARMLIASGAVKGDRVAIWSENRPQWCAAWMGAVIAGCAAVPFDFGVQEADVLPIVAACEPAAIFISSQRASSIPAFRTAAPGIKLVVVFPTGSAPYEEAETEAPPDGALAWTEAREREWKAELPSAESIKSDDVASIIFTSGTTGLSKGVMLGHRGIIANANASILSLPIWKEDVFMDVLPLHHTYPTTCCFISPLCVGASITICEKVVGKVILADARDSGGTIVIGVPLLYDKLMLGLQQNFKAQKPVARFLIGLLFALSRFFGKLGWEGFARSAFKPIRKKAGLGSVRLMVAGGGPLNPRTAVFFNEFGICALQGYGMSENGPLITTNTTRYKDPASAGLRVKYTDLKILEPAADGVGEIAVRSPSLMLGYFRNPEATAAVFTEDGWLRTGDLGRIDDRGFLFITGRSKNIIVSAGGKNIFPEEIEQKFEGSRAIAELLVLGRRRAEGDAAEEVVAVCVPNTEAVKEDYPGREGDRDFLKSLVEAEVLRVNRDLAPYKKIMDVILRWEEFEKTSSKKIRRFLYAKEYGRK